MSDLNIDVGFLCDARHGAEESALFEFSFELDVDAMDEAGFGHCAMFSFVVVCSFINFMLKHVVQLDKR